MKLPLFTLSQAHRRSLEGVVDNGIAAVHEVTRTLVKRQSSSSTDSSSASTCSPGDNSSICQKPVDSTDSQTLPIVLGAVIPITCALVVFIVLHRRYVKRQRLEDANDKHKSLDFGLDISNPTKLSKKRRDVPEMKVTDFEGLGPDPMRPPRRLRGLSMDLGSPYLLPAGLAGSRESIHSMSRSLHDEHDPYRPVTLMQTSVATPRSRNDSASIYSASTDKLSAHEKSNLLSNAQGMSQSFPKRGDSRIPKAPEEQPPTRQMYSATRSVPESRKPSQGSAEQPLANISETNPPRPAATNADLSKLKDLPPPPPVPETRSEQQRPPRSSSFSATRPPRKSSASPSTSAKDASLLQSSSSYFEESMASMPVPQVIEPYASEKHDVDPAIGYAGLYSIATPAPSQQTPVQQQRMSIMGVRPLPPDLPEDNPEVRANRIRSFYKEYFDLSRPNPTDGQYEEDHDANFLNGAVYDPEAGSFAMAGRPFAQAVGRRAMTPPPRGAPRGSGGPPHRRQHSTQSAGHAQFRGRAGAPPPMPKKRMPPPKPLQGLPTPHKLGYDNIISGPIDFAPPISYRKMQNGSRPDTPTGLERPYSPSVRAFTPLASAYDDLAVMPSPHLLRKSGTFTGLDFAPPPKIRNRGGDNASDAGSIRSARSGISAMQLDAVRAGAYRVSRIPKDMVTTREDLANQLRPKWDLIAPA